MKKLSSSLIIGILVIGVYLGFRIWDLGFASTAGFTDVPKDHPNFAAINYIQTQGIVKGYSDGSFKPDNTINRAEFLKILITTIFNQPTIAACKLSRTNLFNDVPLNVWFAPTVCVAKYNKVVAGYTDGTFKPENDINFAEAAKIIAVSFSLKLGTGSNWYDPYVNGLGFKGAIPISITSPDQKITRAEMAEIIYRLKTGEGTASNSANSTGNFDQLKNEVIDLVNKERTKAGLGPLKYNAFLEKSAQAHADDMQKRDFFEHTNPDGKTEEDRIKAAGYLNAFDACNCTKSFTVGENIAKGQVTAADVMDSWMKSPGHRANILNATFSEIGIGIAKITSTNAGNYVGYLWDQNFGDIKMNK